MSYRNLCVSNINNRIYLYIIPIFLVREFRSYSVPNFFFWSTYIIRLEIFELSFITYIEFDFRLNTYCEIN